MKVMMKKRREMVKMESRVRDSNFVVVHVWYSFKASSVPTNLVDISKSDGNLMIFRCFLRPHQ